MFEKKKLRMIQELAKEQQHSNEKPKENKEYKKRNTGDGTLYQT